MSHTTMVPRPFVSQDGQVSISFVSTVVSLSNSGWTVRLFASRGDVKAVNGHADSGQQARPPPLH